jgi:hypothetical protein
VLLSNIYAAVGKWDGAGKVRSLMKTRGVKKRPGHSTVEIDSDVHEFVSSDRSHPQAHLSTQMFHLLDQQRTTFTEATGTGETLNPVVLPAEPLHCIFHILAVPAAQSPSSCCFHDHHNHTLPSRA